MCEYLAVAESGVYAFLFIAGFMGVICSFFDDLVILGAVLIVFALIVFGCYIGASYYCGIDIQVLMSIFDK